MNQAANKEKVTEKPESPSSSASSTELEANTSVASHDDKTSEKVSPVRKVESKENKSNNPSNVPPTQIEVPPSQVQSDVSSKLAQSDVPSKQAQKETLSTKQLSIKKNSETAEKVVAGSTKTPDCEDIPRVKDHTPQQEEVLKKLGESAEKVKI